MPEVPVAAIEEGWAGRLGRNITSPRVLRPIAIGAGFLAGGYALSSSLDAWGRSQHPPLQVGGFPNGRYNPDGSPASNGYAFDPSTGQFYGYGAPPTTNSGPQRANASIDKTLIYVGGAVALGLLAVTLLKGKV